MLNKIYFHAYVLQYKQSNQHFFMKLKFGGAVETTETR